MRPLPLAAAAPLLACALLAAALTPASAEAAALAFDGRFAVQVATLDPIGIVGAGVATVNGAGGGGHLQSLALPSGVFAIAGVVVPVTDPAASPIGGVQATIANLPGSFSGDPLAGSLAIQGVAKVCLFASCLAGPPANVSVPLSVVGVGGSKAVGVFVDVTVTGNPWTTGVAAVPAAGAQITGFAHGPASATSSTANPGGVVRLVTPVTISTNIGASAVLPAFGILTVSFVPEPGTLLLLGSGIAGLVALGRTRRG